MKKHSFILLFAALLLLCACQPTPDEPVVLQKNQDLMIQQGSATLPPEESYTPPEVPERYRFDYQDGALTIHADAEIVEPSVPMPIVNVRAQGIPQETMYQLFNLLSNGEEMYLPRVRTKSQIEATIREWSEMLDAGPEYWGEKTQAEYRRDIEQILEGLKKEYQTAPENSEPRISDGTYDTEKFEWISADCLQIEASNRNREIYAQTFENADHESFFSYFRNLQGFERYTESNTVPYDDTVDLHGLDYAEAAAYVRAFWDAAGGSFEIADVYRVDDSSDGSRDGTVKPAEHYALRFDCRRLVNGVPLAVYASDLGYTDESSYAIGWQQESLRILVDADGIAEIKWYSPLTVMETVSDSTTLLSFDKICGIAEKMIPIIYNPSGWEGVKTQDIEIRSVRLELIRVREQNNVKELKGFLVPVWVLYGTIRQINDYGSGEEQFYAEYAMRGAATCYVGDTMILCINAIDGTIIDPMLGY